MVMPEPIVRIETYAAWTDLRGISSAIEAAGANFEDESVVATIAHRLQTFHKAIEGYADTFAPALVVNDSAILVRDATVGENATTDAMLFLRLAGLLHYATNGDDRNNGGIGARTVICRGIRISIGEDFAAMFAALKQAARREEQRTGTTLNEEDRLWQMGHSQRELGVAHFVSHKQLQLNLAFASTDINFSR